MNACNESNKFLRDRRSFSISPGTSMNTSECNNDVEHLEKQFWGVKAADMCKELIETLEDIWMFYNDKVKRAFIETFSMISEKVCSNIYDEFSNIHLKNVKNKIDRFDQLINLIFVTGDNKDKIEILKSISKGKAKKSKNSEVKELIEEMETISQKKAKLQIEILLEKKIGEVNAKNLIAVNDCLARIKNLDNMDDKTKIYNKEEYFKKLNNRQEKVLYLIF